MVRLSCLLLRVFRSEVGAYQSQVNRRRGSCRFATLTCHFQPTLAVSSLALGMIELRFTACLVFLIGLAALRQSCLMTAVLAAVALPAITRAADIKDEAAFWSSTKSLA